jgi:hypothetical protein
VCFRELFGIFFASSLRPTPLSWPCLDSKNLLKNLIEITGIPIFSQPPCNPKETTIILPILPRAILLILSLPGFVLIFCALTFGVQDIDLNSVNIFNTGT